MHIIINQNIINNTSNSYPC